MIRSMTGYGRGSVDLPGLRVTVELRTVNNRFVDLKLKLPAEAASLEAAIRKRILTRIRRGRLEMTIQLDRTEDTDGGYGLNRPLVRAALAAAAAAREEFGVAGEVDVGTLLRHPEALVRAPGRRDLEDEGCRAVERAVDAALEALDAERRREGEALQEDILARVDRMRERLASVRERAGEIPEIVQGRLRERLETLARGMSIDPARLAQEAAFLADRCDVTEELVRLEGHLLQAKTILERPDGEPIGKRLDFLLQEIHRETNTLNAKASDLEVARHTLEIRSEAEKIREQAQNLE